MKKLKYVNTMLKIRKLGNFVDIHNCGYPTENWPVNLYCRTADGITIYVALIYGKWSIEWSYDPEMEVRSWMPTRHGIRTQTEALEYVKRILAGEFRTNERITEGNANG